MKRTYLWIIGGVLIVALLAGGAFMAMRLLNARGQNLALGGGGKDIISLHTSGGGPGGGGQSFSYKLIPAPELPKQAADLRGMVTSVQNNSIYVAQADKMMMAVQNGKVISPTPSGPSTEVVVSKDTKIYRDTTMDSLPQPSGSSSPDNPQQLQQKLELVDISAITAGNGAAVQVWGQRRGDRLNAEVIVVSAPAVMKGAGPKQVAP